jgi:HK97 gp10 family phage protein
VSVQIKGVEQTLKNLEKYSSDTQDKIAKAIAGSAIRIRTDAMRSIKGSPASGATYTRGNITHTASSPGNPPRIDTGRLYNSIRWVLSPVEAVIGVFGSMNLKGRLIDQSEGNSDSERADYALYLEMGTQHIKPRKFLTPAFERERNIFKNRLAQALRTGK